MQRVPNSFARNGNGVVECNNGDQLVPTVHMSTQRAYSIWSLLGPANPMMREGQILGEESSSAH